MKRLARKEALTATAVSKAEGETEPTRVSIEESLSKKPRSKSKDSTRGKSKLKDEVSSPPKKKRKLGGPAEQKRPPPKKNKDKYKKKKPLDESATSAHPPADLSAPGTHETVKNIVRSTADRAKAARSKAASSSKVAS